MLRFVAYDNKIFYLNNVLEMQDIKSKFSY